MNIITALVALILTIATISTSLLQVDALVITWANGSSLILQPDLFNATFPKMQQAGLAPGTYAWYMSLAAEMPLGNRNCYNVTYARQGASCNGVSFDRPIYETISRDDGFSLIYLTAPNSDGLVWRATMNITCDLMATQLTSPSNSYYADQPGLDIQLNFNLRSAGACLPVSPSPATTTFPPPPYTTTFPPPPSPSTRTTVYFANGSKLELFPQFFTREFQLQQNGLAGGFHTWFFSMLQKSTFDENCGTNPTYIGMGGGCTQNSFDEPAISVTPNTDESGVYFVFRSQRAGLQFQLEANVVCHPTAPVLIDYLGTYSAKLEGSNIILNFKFGSRGACLNP